MVEALKSWSQEGFHLQHYVSLHALVQIEIYTGDSEVARKHVEGEWQALENSQLFRTPGVALEAMQLRARARKPPTMMNESGRQEKVCSSGNTEFAAAHALRQHRMNQIHECLLSSRFNPRAIESLKDASSRSMSPQTRVVKLRRPEKRCRV